MRSQSRHHILIDMKRQYDEFAGKNSDPPAISEANSAEKICDWPDCPGTGEHRAPKSRQRINDFYWFCLDHVRIYNRSWNYYEGMSDDQVEALVRSDTTWNRPTWPLGSLNEKPENGAGGHRQGPADVGNGFERMSDPFGFFGEDIGNGYTPDGNLPATERKALALLDLDYPVSVDEVKTRYKELVKRFHPDANGGDKKAVERFKLINDAYRTIIAFLSA